MILDEPTTNQSTPTGKSANHTVNKYFIYLTSILSRILRGYPIFSMSMSKYYAGKRRNLVVLVILGLPALLEFLLRIRGISLHSQAQFFEYVIYFGHYFYNVTFAILVPLFFASYIINDEIADKTITYLLHSTITKEEVFGWKFLSLIIYCIIMFLPIMTVSYFSFVIFVNPNYKTLINFLLFLAVIRLTIISILLWSSVFFLLCIITDHPIIFGLVIGFIDQIILNTFLPNLLGAYSLNYHIEAIAADSITGFASIDNFTP